MEAYFVIAHTKDGSKKFKLCDDEYVVVGRSDKYCQVTINDPLSSSKHCKISMADGVVTVEDLNSKNGIFLNGVRIIKQSLFIDDKLKVGDSIVYILENKLNEKDKDLLTYKGSGSRKSGDLTLEIGAPSITNRDLGRQSREKPSSEGGGLAARKKIVPIEFTPSRNTSKVKLMILDLSAFLIDLAIAMTIFILGVKSFSFLFTKDYEVLAKKNSLLKIMFSNELSPYTFIVFLVAAGVFYFNRKKQGGSIGERVLKIN